MLVSFLERLELLVYDIGRRMRILQMSYLLLAQMGYIARGQGVQRLDKRVYVSLLRVAGGREPECRPRNSISNSRFVADIPSRVVIFVGVAISVYLIGALLNPETRGRLR
jgi:hypothetical protein